MTYLEILSWARKGIKARQTELRGMQDKALEAVGSMSEARKLADVCQEEIDMLDVRLATLEELEDIHNRK